MKKSAFAGPISNSSHDPVAEEGGNDRHGNNARSTLDEGSSEGPQDGPGSSSHRQAAIHRLAAVMLGRFWRCYPADHCGCAYAESGE